MRKQPIALFLGATIIASAAGLILAEAQPGQSKPGDSATAGELKPNLRLLNPNIFGKPVTEPVRLLEKDVKGEAIDPDAVEVDVKKGRFYAATVRYPKAISFKKARAQLNERYAAHEVDSFQDDPTMGLWRNERGRYAIQLTADKEHLIMLYITFQPAEQVLENIQWERARRAAQEKKKESREK